MNLFRCMVRVCPKARVSVGNSTPTEQEEMAKGWSEHDIQREAWCWRRAQSKPQPRCLWRHLLSASTLTQPISPDRKVLCWCVTFMYTSNYTTLRLDLLCMVSILKIAYLQSWKSRRSHWIGKREDVGLYWSKIGVWIYMQLIDSWKHWNVTMLCNPSWREHVYPWISNWKTSSN